MSTTETTAHLDGHAAPLVSVIVRSIGRETLQQALDSVATQTYPNIEIVVVNAKGPGHPELGEKCGRFPINVITSGESLGRCRAANVGLDNAKGKYLIFLDDDDFFLPNHISALVAELENDKAIRVAYAGVESTDKQGTSTGKRFNETFRMPRLFGGNFIPIHAVLFDRSLIESGCRFDEQFQVYEDWDFWLQLSRQSRFLHVDQVSACYRTTGTSGVGPHADDTSIRKARARIYDKWKSLWSGAQIEELIQETQEATRSYIEHLERELSSRSADLEKSNNLIDDINGNLREIERQLREKERFIQEIFASSSWRFSAPIRWLSLQRQSLSEKLKKWFRRLLGIHSWPYDLNESTSGRNNAIRRNYEYSPLISVILPVYNACRSNKQFLLNALESVASQTYRKFELIIVDDGSTDDTQTLCEEFVSSRPSLVARILSKANGGQSSARNFGVEASKGEYIAFIDQDDEWYFDKLARVSPFLGNASVDVVYTDADIIDQNGTVVFDRIHQIHHNGWPHPKRSLEDILFKDAFVMPGVMIIKKNALLRAGGFDESLSGYEDDDLFLRLFEQCNIYYLPEPTLRWRMYGDNYSSSHRMLTSRTCYWRKLLNNYTDGGNDRFRVEMISLRFFWEFMKQALVQYRDGNELFMQSLDGAKEIVPFLPRFQKVLFKLAFILPVNIRVPVFLRIKTVFRALL